MADIFHHFRIKASAGKVFGAVSTPRGLDAWWTDRSAGRPAPGGEYTLSFGPGYEWKAVVSACDPGSAFELRITDSHEDWQGTRVGFHLAEKAGVTTVRFHHLGWPEMNDHYRTSCYCWAMYLRLLRRYVEQGTIVPYAQRLDA